MEHSPAPDFDEYVPDPLLGHVQRLSRVEDLLVKRHQSIQVRTEKGDVVDAPNEAHLATSTTAGPISGIGAP